MSARPAVSVVVPFFGDGGEARALVGALSSLRLGRGDQLIVADNTVVGAFLSENAEKSARRAESPFENGQIRAVRANGERSSYHARNVGAREARTDWLLFMDADCVPAPDLLDAYFREPVPARCAILAGEISGDPGQGGLLPRYARARNFLSQTEGLHGKAGSAGATANLLVRRAAFEAVGGFEEGIRSGGDVDLCWRLMAAGWTLDYRHDAGVVHRHRETLLGFMGQIARYAAGARWLNERYPGSSDRWPLVHGLVGSARDIAANALRGRLEEATFRGIDAIGLIAHSAGYRLSNAARRDQADA